MTHKITAITATVVSAFVFSSCMHFAMTGMQGHERQTQQTSLEKEVTSSNIKATALFPPMEKDKEAAFTLKLIDAMTGKSISGARVYGHFEYLRQNDSKGMNHDMMMDMHMDSMQQMNHAEMAEHSDSVQNVSDHADSFHQEVLETGGTGKYIFSQTPQYTGEYTIAFHITDIGERKLDSEIIITATRTVTESSSHSHGGMMGMGSSSTYIIVGAAVMGAMMLIVLGARGGMF